MDPRAEQQRPAISGDDLSHLLLRCLPLGVLALDRRGHVLAANPELSRLLDRDAAQVVGKPLPPGIAATAKDAG